MVSMQVYRSFSLTELAMLIILGEYLVCARGPAAKVLEWKRQLCSVRI
jgi:hypothetical protein